MPLYEVTKVKRTTITQRIKADSKELAITRVECGSSPGTTGTIEKTMDEQFGVEFTVTEIKEVSTE